MAAEYLYPDANHNTLWGVHDYSYINEEITQPTEPTGLSCRQRSTDDNEDQAWSIGNVTSLTEITEVKVWASIGYLEEDGGDFWLLKTPNVQLYFNGSTQIDTTLSTTADEEFTWDSASVSGTWTAAELDDMRASLDFGIIGSNDDGYLHSLYVELTGTVGGGEGGDSEACSVTHRTMIPRT